MGTDDQRSGRRAETSAHRGVMLVVEILVTSIIGEALFLLAFRDSFDRYWSKLGPAAVPVMEPAADGVGTFALISLVFLVVLTPVMSVAYGAMNLLPVRWYEYGRLPWYPSGWFRKNPAMSRGRSIVLIVAGVSTGVLAWLTAIFLPGLLGVNVLVVLVVLALTGSLFRSFTRRTRLSLAIGFLALVVLMPGIIARLETPNLDPTGDDDSPFGQMFFEPKHLFVAHLVTPDGERPMVILGRTVLGDLVVYDACTSKGTAEVVGREDIVVPERLRPCP